MKSTLLFMAVFVAVLIAIVFPERVAAGPYLEEDEGLPDDYSENAIENLLQNAAQKRSSLIYLFRRGCVPRNGNCDHRPNDCCYNSSCRCNLWGSNCRCQRMGLFQKWG